MNQEFKETIHKAFTSLPRPAQDIILSNETNEVMQDLTQKYRLHIDKADILSQEIMGFIVGLTPVGSFVDRIQKNIGLKQTEAAEIVTEVNQKILHHIREALHKATESAENEDILSPVSTPAPEAFKLETSAQGADFVRERMAGTIQLPHESRETIELPKEGSKPGTGYHGGDPYREPIE